MRLLINFRKLIISNQKRTSKNTFFHIQEADYEINEKYSNSFVFKIVLAIQEH